MARKDIVVVGASAGGMNALEWLAAGLPKDFPAAMFVVWHLAPGVHSILPRVLEHAGPVAARNPDDGDRIEPGRIYGALDDGTSGLWAIKLRGGTAFVQDPEDAQHRSMPLNALENVDVDYKLPAAEIGPLLGRLVREPAGAEPAAAPEQLEQMAAEVKIAAGRDAIDENISQYGKFSAFACPECHGVLTLLREGSMRRYRCHTGHAYSADALVESATEQVEHGLWSAVRSLDETVLLLNQLGEEFASNGDTRAAEFCFSRAREAYERSQPIREAAMRAGPVTADEAAGGEVPATPVRVKQA